MAAKALKLTGNGRDLLGQLFKRRRLDESRQLGDIGRDVLRSFSVSRVTGLSHQRVYIDSVILILKIGHWAGGRR